MKRNCANCKHLDYYDGGWSGEDAGYSCGGRNYDRKGSERIHLQQLNEPDYRLKSKRCCELRGPRKQDNDNAATQRRRANG